MKRLIAGLTLVLCAVVLWVGWRQVVSVSPVVADYRYRPKVIVDPGHGGEDGGAVGASNSVEKEINLSISLMLRDMLRISGFEVVMTRETDISIHDPSAKTISQKKTSDLRNRLALMKQHPDALILSIHQNKFTQEKYSGAQVFYGTQLPEASKRLAQTIQDNIKTQLQPENYREIKESYDSLYLLCNAPAPIVLVECGFLSNRREEALLCDPDYQKQMAFLVYISVLEYLQNSP